MPTPSAAPDAGAGRPAGAPAAPTSPASPPAPSAPAHKRRLRRRVAVGLAAGGLLVLALLALAGPEATRGLLATLAAADVRLVAAAVGAYAAFFALRGLRWWILLGPGASGPGTASLLTSAGWLVSTVAPFKAGDVLRIAWAARRHRVALGASAGTVALERALDVVGLALAASLALLAVHLGGATVPALLGDLVAIAWLLPLLGLAVLALVAHLVPPHRRSNAVLRFAGDVADQLPALARRPRALAPVAGLTTLVVLAQSLVFACLLLAFRPDTSPLLALAGAPLFLLSFGLAFTPAHLGTYEAAFVAVYGALLGNATSLVPVAIAVHIATASTVAVLGGLSFTALWALPGPRATAPPPGPPAGPPVGHATGHPAPSTAELAP